MKEATIDTHSKALKINLDPMQVLGNLSAVIVLAVEIALASKSRFFGDRLTFTPECVAAF